MTLPNWNKSNRWKKHWSRLKNTCRASRRRPCHQHNKRSWTKILRSWSSCREKTSNTSSTMKASSYSPIGLYLKSLKKPSKRGGKWSKLRITMRRFESFKKRKMLSGRESLKWRTPKKSKSSPNVSCSKRRVIVWKSCSVSFLNNWVKCILDHMGDRQASCQAWTDTRFIFVSKIEWMTASATNALTLSIRL